MSIGRILGQVGSSAGSRVVSALLSFLLLVLMARSWNPAELGVYVVAFNWFQIFQLAPLLGSHFELARQSAAEEVELESELSTVAAMGLIFAIPIGGLLILVAKLVSGSADSSVFWAAALALLPSAPIAVIEMALVGRQRFHLLSSVAIGESLLRCLVIGALLLFAVNRNLC